MKKETSTLNKIKTLLGLEVKLATMMLVDGQTTLEAEAFESGYEVFVQTPDGNVPVPVGEYELETGDVMVVVEEGMIAEIKPMTAETEEVEAPATEEAPAEMNREPKKTIQTTSTETHFSAEIVQQIENLTKENEELKTKLAKLEEVNTELSSEPAVKPISFNPENTNPVKVMKLQEKRERNTTDRVFSKLFN